MFSCADALASGRHKAADNAHNKVFFMIFKQFVLMVNYYWKSPSPHRKKDMAKHHSVPSPMRVYQNKLLRLVGEVARSDGGVSRTQRHTLCVSVGVKPLRPVGPAPLQGGAVASRRFCYTLATRDWQSLPQTAFPVLSRTGMAGQGSSGLFHAFPNLEQHLFRIAATQLTVTCRIKMQRVYATGATGGRNHIGRRNHLRKGLDDGIH